jgi:carbon-monoxide dehydrogenase medium subunit
MKAAPFTLHRPATLEEAVHLLSKVGDEGGLILAGGQSLTPMMALRLAYPPHLVDINNIADLDSLKVDEGQLLVGATVRHCHFHRPLKVAGQLGDLLAQVVRYIAHYPIRLRGTFCGSIAHADPASEWCLVAATLDAHLSLMSVRGTRSVSFDDYVDSALSTTRVADEVLIEARLPLLSDETQFGFYEFSRRAGDFALGMALAVYELRGSVIRNARIGIGGIEMKARRIKAAEQALEGRTVSAEAFAAAAAATVNTVDAMEDPSTPRTYRQDLSGVVVRRALQASLHRASI